MKRQWRFLVLNETYADYSIGTSPALERGVMEGVSPDTVVLDIFPEDSFTVGVLDDPEKAIDLEFCRKKGIIVRRRNTTGGTIYSAKGSAVICYYLKTSDPLVPQSIGEAFPRMLGDFAEAAKQLFGFPAKYRPLNDVEVEGRKLMPSSCKIERNTLVFRLLLNVKPQNVEVTSKAILLSPEKVQDKILKTVEERLTHLEREAGREILLLDLRNFVRKAVTLSFAEVDLVPGEMNPAEKKYWQEFRELYSREGWLLANTEAYRFKRIPSQAKRGEQRVKAVAGLIRAVILKHENRIYDLIITGDFHPRPHTILADMENALRHAPAQADEIKRRIEEIYDRPGVEISGTTPDDFVSAVIGALEKAS
ncbi:MAG: lipoate--protein ligase family protein [Deltaproteobacteria bacterium]|nr:lipoate--protein ligase family protein [Deltaproteobacteria bacterium]